MTSVVSKQFRWDDFVSAVAKRLPPQQFRAWLEPTRLISITDQTLKIAAPTKFSRDWVVDHYKEHFREALVELYGRELEVIVEVQGASSPETSSQDVTEHLNLSLQTNNESSSGASPSQKDSPSENSSLEQSAQGDRHSPHVPDGGGLAGLSESPDSDLPLFGGSNQSFESSLENSKSARQDRSTAGLPNITVATSAATNRTSAPATLDPKHTFDTFVVGASNQFAHAAARAVAEQPAGQYNPLFLYSAAGLGKTHLLHAIGNHLIRENQKIKICYIPAEKFVNDLIDSIRHEKMSQFRSRYRDGCDVLLMDDIQFIAGKDRTQEEFFHTFNTLLSSRRQIVVTSDKFPKDIPGLEERIRTRFEWGLIADIQPPEIETRIAILRAKAELDDIFLPNDVALFLASNIKTNIRELEGALIRLGAQASLSGVEISLEMAKREMKNQIKEPSITLSPDVILDVVAKHFGLKVGDLKGKERSRRIVLPRQLSMYFMRRYCVLSFPEIGTYLGGKDHSTVVHGVKAVTMEIEKDPDMRRHVESIQNQL